MAQKMRAVRLFAPKDIRCVEVDVPHIEKDTQVLIKVKSCGVCGSDIPRVMVKGTYHFPTTIGHEFAGQIVDCGDKVKNNLTVGDRVSVMPLIPCGECQYCKVGQSHLCDHYDYYGSRRDGAMAEYVVVESANCLKSQVTCISSSRSLFTANTVSSSASSFQIHTLSRQETSP